MTALAEPRTLWTAAAITSTTAMTSEELPALELGSVRFFLALTLGSFSSVEVKLNVQNEAATWFNLGDAQKVKMSTTFTANFTGCFVFAANEAATTQRMSHLAHVGINWRVVVTAAGTPGTNGSITLIQQRFRMQRTPRNR